MKNSILAGIGVVGSVIASLYGGWTEAMTTLFIFMALDYTTGLIVAGVFHKSPKTETGTLESRAGLKGLIRKGVIMAIVLVGHRIDLAFGTTYIKDGVCIAFIANELISLIENAGLMGVYVPPIISKSIDLLNKKGEGEDGKIIGS